MTDLIVYSLSNKKRSDFDAFSISPGILNTMNF